MKVGQKWEWIKGDKIGTTETIISIDEKWVNFINSRCSIELLNEFMSLIIDFYEEDERDKIDTNLLESFHNRSMFSKSAEEQPIKNTHSNFYLDILQKAKCDDKIKIQIEFDIDFISDDKIKMLIEMYGDEMKSNLDIFIRNTIKEELIMSSISTFTDTYK